MDSIQQEDNMNKPLKDFNTNDLYLLVKSHLYKDLAPVHGLQDAYVSESTKVVVQFYAHDKHQEFLPQNTEKYHKLMAWAEAAGREPLYILSTPLGIWEFNLELTDPEFVNTIPCFNINKGEPILVWYPMFNSEDDWITSAMEEMAEDRYTDPSEMDLEGMMEELLNYEGNLDTYAERQYD